MAVTLRQRGPRHVLAWTVLAVTGAVLFDLSFETWGDVIIDLGRDLYVPSQILEGRILYRELLYNYGPAAPYLLAAVTAILGDALWVFAAFGMAVGVAALGALYAVGVRLGGVVTGWVTAMLFLLLSCFGGSTWGCNFVFPYSFSATLGTAFALWSFYCLLRYLDGGRAPESLIWSVAFLFAALLAKQETGLGIALVHVLAWWVRKVPLRAVLGTLGAGALVGGLFLAAFAARGPDEHALFAENLAKFAADPDPFFSVVAGLDRPGPNLLRSLGETGKLAAMLLLAALGGLFVERARGDRAPRWAIPAAVSLAGCAGLVWLWAQVRLFQATPIVAVAVLVVFLVRDRDDPLLLVAAFSLFAGLRVLLQFHPLWYGFYLVVPAYPLVVFGGRRFAARTATGPRGRRTVAGFLLALAVVLAGRFESDMLGAYRSKTSVLETSKGSLRDFPTGRSEAIAEFLAYAANHLAASEPQMVVMPEGATLNYFTGFANPTAYYLFTPPEIGSSEVERRMIRELEATQPEYLLFSSRDLSEFGKRGIGLDYALELGDWIRGSYDLERVFEAGEDRIWRLVLLRRRAPP